MMNLCMEEYLESSVEPEIILLENLSQSQWQTLLAQIQYRIKLTAENQIALALSGAEIIPLLELDRLGDITLESPTSRALNLANTLYYQGRYEEAIKQYQRFSQFQVGDVSLFLNFSDCWRKINKISAAIAILEQGICNHPKAGQLHFEVIKICQQSGRTKSAISNAEVAAKILPNEYVFQLLKHLTLPIIYDNKEEI
ncbi:tetratricopeptide repeat protein [Microcoleus sp. PH2017_02_FOX_O_A]|nr:tetratricopeptide repeat protein [Microcoleus sp. PH2017_02_FOX_O_A]